MLDRHFIPPNLNCAAFPQLIDFFKKKLKILIKRRADEIAEKLDGLVVSQDLLRLQMFNRYEPVLDHFSNDINLHPEDLYRLAIQLAGELTTFAPRIRRPRGFPPYDHDDLQAIFSPVINLIENCLNIDPERPAIQLPLSEPKANTYGAIVPEPSMLDNFDFVLIVSADMPSEDLPHDFPRKIIIAPVEKIARHIKALMPGISIHPMEAVPPQLKFYKGYTYFRLEKGDDLWKEMKESGGFAIHIGGEFPGLKMEFWAYEEG